MGCNFMNDNSILRGVNAAQRCLDLFRTGKMAARSLNQPNRRCLDLREVHYLGA